MKIETATTTSTTITLTKGDIEKMISDKFNLLNDCNFLWDFDRFGNGHLKVVSLISTNNFNSKYAFTCDNCDDKGECEYAWDQYNKNGECLAIK